jgi:hypothetical protein
VTHPDRGEGKPTSRGELLHVLCGRRAWVSLVAEGSLEHAVENDEKLVLVVARHASSPSVRRLQETRDARESKASTVAIHAAFAAALIADADAALEDTQILEARQPAAAK